MPELPEVETVRRGLAPQLVGRRIVEARVRERRLRWPIPPGFEAAVRGRQVGALVRRAKYLIATLDSGDRLLLHLGMSGRLRVLPAAQPAQRHDHVDLLLDSGQLVRLHDPRRFGAVLLWPAGQDSHPLLAGLGPEPFSPAFDAAYLHRAARGRRATVKAFVMDGRVVVGAGNIYASEALFRAGIRPTRAAGRLSRADCERLVAALRAVLGEAVAQGGTTLRDFAGADGQAGYFQQVLSVYGRAGEPCPRCAAPVQQRVIAQRSSYWCARCQR